MAVTLRRWNQLREFLRIIALTGYVENGRPQSVFLVGEPGHGKTELIELFRPNQHLAFYSDMTYRTVIDVARQASKGAVTHIVCTEFQKVLARRRHIADSTLTALMMGMEEGFYTVAFGGKEWNLGGAKLGIIAGTTVTSMSKNPQITAEYAMDSRAFFIDASGTKEELLEIERRIAQGDTSALKPVYLKSVPDKKLKVSVPPRIAEKVRAWVREMEAHRVKVYGVRTYTKFLRTLQGAALFEGRETVTRADMDKLYSFKNLWLKPPPMPEEEMGEHRAGLGEGGGGRS